VLSFGLVQHAESKYQTEGVGTVRLGRGNPLPNSEQDDFEQDADAHIDAAWPQPVGSGSICGIILLEVHGAEDLPKVKNGESL
jgi:hypothetical protein